VAHSRWTEAKYFMIKANNAKEINFD
jgi:hypothetical protein